MDARADPRPSRVARFAGIAGGTPGQAAAIALAAAGTIAYLSFNAGGFFPDVTGIVVVALVALLVVFVSVAAVPLGAMRARLALGVGAMAAFALWQLVSASWSHAPGRAAVEFDRSLLYLLALAAGGLIVDRGWRLRALVYGTALGLGTVAFAGLLSRVLPAVFPVAPQVENNRLTFPLTYWNAVGIVSAVAVVLCLGLSGSDREPRAVRIVTAAAIPGLAATVLLTFSRGSIAAGVVGVVLCVMLAPRRHMLAALAAVAPAAVFAVSVAYGADALVSDYPTSAAAVRQGHHVALMIGLATLAAGLLRAVLVATVDRRFDRIAPVSRRVRTGLVVAALVLGAGTAAAVSLPDRLDQQYRRFVRGTHIADRRDVRTRLSNPGNHGRLDLWRVSRDAYRSERLHGTGAGTYEVLWARRRPENYAVVNAHSLYLETLGDLGVVGLGLVLAALLALLGGMVSRLRRADPERALWATLTAVSVAWLLEAGVDWTWQMPSTAVWMFAAGGAALSRPSATPPVEGAAPSRRRRTPSTLRLVAALGLLVVAITPVRLALSQHHLNTSIDALRRGDCRGSVSEAIDSADALGARAEPFELLAYCDARLGLGPLSIDMARRAIARDPANWQYRYDLALVQAAAGRDPRPSIAYARRLNPLSGMLDTFQKAVRTGRPATWRRQASRSPLLIPSRAPRRGR